MTEKENNGLIKKQKLWSFFEATIIACFFIATIMSSNANAEVDLDSILTEIRTAIKEDVTDAKLLTLEEKYKGWGVRGNGYVIDVQGDVFGNGLTILLAEEDPADRIIFKPPFKISVPEKSSAYSVTKKLSRGQLIQFSGKFADISWGSILIKGKVMISPQ